MAARPGRRTPFARGAWLVAALLGAACAKEAEVTVPTLRPDPEAGRATYMRACAPCHGADGRGEGTRAASLAVPAADLTLLAHRHGGTYSPDLVTDVLTGWRDDAAHRSGGMPVWATEFGPRGSGAAAAGSLKQQIRIAEVAAFVGTLQRTPED